MVFSRLVVSSLFLITVIIVPVSVPVSPARRAAAAGPVRISESPALVAAAEEAGWRNAVASPDPDVRREAILESLDRRGAVPAVAAAPLALHIADDELVREAIMNIGAPAADALEERLASPRLPDRAAAASLLARLAPITWAPRILPVACAALRGNDEPGDARFGVMALLSIGAASEEPVRALLAGRDDQAAACAIIVLSRLGVLREEDLALAAAPLDRLAFAWPASDDDADVVVEAYAALGGLGVRLLQVLSCAARPDALPRAVALGQACADPARETWQPRGRRSRLMKIE